MEPMMSLVMAVVGAGAAIVLVASGLFSVASLLWGDLLEPEGDRDAASPVTDLSKAA